jgi:hypothetical protein
MPGNFRWPDTVKRPDEYWGDTSYSKMAICAVEPQTIHQIGTRAFLSWRRHPADHIGVSHVFVLFLSANAELVTMLGEMNRSLQRVDKGHGFYDTSFARLC